MSDRKTTSFVPAPRRLRAHARLIASAPVALCALLSLLAGLLLAGLPPALAAPVTGNATWFTSLGAPYGGCGLPQSELDSPHFVALNVFNTPGDYNGYPRPIPAADAARMGAFENGRNCGRFVRVTIGDYCTGVNDGAANQPFCRNGSWVADSYNGATLTMLVADSCADSNGWCRDDPHHLDLAEASLNQFVKNGAPVGDMHPGHWNNRHVSWEYVPAPDYSGDIEIGFLQAAQVYWPAISVSHLADGIHGVQYWDGGGWRDGTMNGDMGQSYVIGPTTAAGRRYAIRVLDASDKLINNGRVYEFSLPASCSDRCGPAYTPVAYTIGTGPGGGDPTPTPTGTATPPTPTTPPGVGCSAAYTVTGSWFGGHQAEITVANNGTAPLNGWSVGLTLPGSQTVANAWNATVTQSGNAVTATNAGHNGTVPVGGSTSWGMVVNGERQPPSDLTCTPR